MEYLILAGGKSWENRAAQAAFGFFAMALRIAEGAKLSLDPKTESVAHLRKGEASFLMGNIDEALEESGKAAGISRQHGIVEIERDSLRMLAVSVMTSSMKDDEAFRFFDQAIGRARDLGQKSTESVILTSKGVILCYLGQLYHGHQMIVEAEELARSTQDQRAIFHNRGRLALSERWVGRPGKAIELTEGLVEELRSIFGMHYLPLVIWIRGLALGVLDLAAAKAGWGSPLPAGRARGIAVHQSFGSHVAQGAEVSVQVGRIRVHRVVCAIACGTAVNPATIEAQMESGIAFGLGATLASAITFKDGRVQESNFDDYKVLRLPDMPRVEVHIVPSRERPGGVGEPGTPPIAPAVDNAVAALTGQRLRELPLKLRT